MAINQETAAIKARMDRIPAALSPDLVERIAADRVSGVVNPYRCGDDQVIRRVDRAADQGTLMRPAFMRDAEKILHLPAYARYAGKTQVFSFRSNDDLSRRGLHVQLVSRIARDIGRALGLNCDLIEAIGLGHDLGHTPFGHAGERFLNDIYHECTGRYFFHNVQSVRVLDALYGRNVSLQTLDGVLCHNGEYEQRVFELSDMSSFDQFDRTVEDCIATGYSAIEHLRPMTLEGCVVRISDILAYVGRDRRMPLRQACCHPTLLTMVWAEYTTAGSSRMPPSISLNTAMASRALRWARTCLRKSVELSARTMRRSIARAASKATPKRGCARRSKSSMTVACRI